MSPNTNEPTTPTSTNLSTSSTSSTGQRNRAQFKGSKSLRPNGRNRFNKRKRSGGAPRQDSAPSRAPLNAYLSVCCGLPARKPQTGRKDKVQNPESSSKTKEIAKGLGKWKCQNCGKACKVTVIKSANAAVSPSLQPQTVKDETGSILKATERVLMDTPPRAESLQN